MLSVLLDPSVLFGLSVYLSPLFIAGDFTNPQALIAYFTDPVSIIGVVALVVTLFATHKSGHNMPKLTSSDKRAALWYLVNGVVIHIMMDGLVGSFSAHNIFLPPMTLHYSILDKRFQRGDPNALVVTLTELLLMGPLCLFAYRARVLQRPYRAVLEAVVSALQLFGTIAFVVPEIMHGYPNVPIDREFTFSFHHTLYFWFAFVFCNPIWIVVPVMLIVQAFKDVSALVTGQTAKKSK